MIRFEQNKKLVDYLKPNQKNLILFNDHGMGDVIMFMPIYQRLKELYPDVVFNLKCNRGQEYFDEITESSYDNEFYIKFPEYDMRPWYPKCIGKSKPEISCTEEIGLKFDETMEFTWKPKE